MEVPEGTVKGFHKMAVRGGWGSEEAVCKLNGS